MKRIEDTVGVAGLVVVSVMVLGAFFALTYLVLTRSVPDGNRDLANVLLGSLGTMATGIVYHWTGSSRGSSAKDRIIEQQLANKP